MTKYVCITSMNGRYFDHCGKACIDTYAAHWPIDIPLLVYNEDMWKPKKKKNVQFIDWTVLGNDFVNFCERHQHESRVVIFAKKAFSIIHAMENVDCDRLIWLDADCATVAPLPTLLLDLISPDDKLSSHFGVVHPWPTETDPDRTAFSCETGFFILNKKHPMFPQFVARYKEYYINDLSENIRRFYDGEVYGAVVAEMEGQGASMMELNPGRKHRTPIPRSIIGPFIQHYKAGAKEGRTNNSILSDIKLAPQEKDNDEI